MACVAIHAARRVLLTTALLLAIPAAAQSIEAERYRASIDSEEDTNGLTAPGLVEPLQSLGLLFVAQGQHAEAAAMFARARQVLRVNEGFETAHELELIMLQKRAEAASGNFATAWELDQALVVQAGAKRGALETYRVYSDLAATRLDLLARYNRGAHPPEIVMGCYYSRERYAQMLSVRSALVSAAPAAVGDCAAGERGTVQSLLLLEARYYQVLALEALLQNARYASDEFLDMVAAVLRTSGRIQRSVRIGGDPFLAYTLRRILSYEPQNPDEIRRRALILVLLADMNVERVNWYGRAGSDFDTIAEQYEQAYQELLNEGMDAGMIEGLFTPGLPVVLPSYDANPLAPRVEDTASARYIDVAFAITRRGKASDIEIAASSDSVTRAERRNFERLLQDLQFRPRLLEGKVAASAPVTLRYYLPASPL
jgi:tetratricopeptide (TPR) repeat protein